MSYRYEKEEIELYLLDRAIKLDEEFNSLRSYLIDNGQVNYVTTTFNKWNKGRVCMSGTRMLNGRILLDDFILQTDQFEDFQERQKELIQKGCTTLAVAPKVQYESEIDSEYKRTIHNLASSTLDFVIGLTIPATMLRSEVLRKCQQLKIPFLRVIIDHENELERFHWTHLSNTLLSYPLTIIPMFKTPSKKIEERWRGFCSYYGIHTSAEIIHEEIWNKALLQKTGLYPQKGALIGGSDADYLLFAEDSRATSSSIEKVATEGHIVYHKKEPDVVVLKGEIVKVYDSILLKPGFGKKIQVVRPGRFLSLIDIESNDQQQVNYV